MDTNGHGLIGFLLVAARPDTWPTWLRQVVAGATVVFITSFVGTSLALWREHSVIFERMNSILLKTQVNERDIAENRARIQRIHERISAHIGTGHTPVTWPNQPPQK